MTSNLSIYLNQLQKQLDDIWNIKVSIATLSHILRSLQYSQKSPTKVLAEWDESLHSV